MMDLEYKGYLITSTKGFESEIVGGYYHNYVAYKIPSTNDSNVLYEWGFNLCTTKPDYYADKLKDIKNKIN